MVVAAQSGNATRRAGALLPRGTSRTAAWTRRGTDTRARIRRRTRRMGQLPQVARVLLGRPVWPDCSPLHRACHNLGTSSWKPPGTLTLSPRLRLLRTALANLALRIPLSVLSNLAPPSSHQVKLTNETRSKNTAYWGEPKDLFAAIADGTTPEDRQLRVTRWFLATLSGQFTRREKETVRGFRLARGKRRRD